MSELISEVDAFIAWKNGQEVEIYDESMCWHTLCRDHGLCVFDSNGRVKFRLKPCTITINSIEVPAPFEPKEDCFVFILDDSKTDGYRKYDYEVDGDSGSVFIGVWKSEDDIEKVVDALRSIFNVEW